MFCATLFMICALLCITFQKNIKLSLLYKIHTLRIYIHMDFVPVRLVVLTALHLLDVVLDLLSFKTIINAINSYFVPFMVVHGYLSIQTNPAGLPEVGIK